jgi:hypothetical protein
MKFEEYYNELDAQPEHVPGTVPPPFVTPTRTDLLRRYSDQVRGFVTNRNQRTDLLRSYSDAINRPAPTSRPSASPAQDLNPAINADLARFGRSTSAFLGPRSTTNPSFQPMAGETPALQMPGLKDKLAALGLKFLQGYANPPPGFRDMPRSPNAPFIPEQNTQVIPGPAQPQGTPYPAPPFLNFQNWLNTGERGPLPLDSRRPGYYPAPANTPMPEAYDALTSGGLLS